MIRNYQDDDYEMVMSWFDARNMRRVHPKVLSPHGFIIPNVCALWMYPTESDFIYLENLISNPDAIRKAESVSSLIDTAIKWALEMDYKFMLSVTDNPSVIKKAIMKGAKMTSSQTLITFQLK